MASSQNNLQDCSQTPLGCGYYGSTNDAELGTEINIHLIGHIAIEAYGFAANQTGAGEGIRRLSSGVIARSTCASFGIDGTVAHST